MSLQIVQNQQLKPIGDKVAIDTQLSTTSENAISNKAVTEEINQINSDLSELPYAIKVTPTANVTSDTAGRVAIGNYFTLPNNAIPIFLMAINGSTTFRFTSPMFYGSNNSFFSVMVTDTTGTVLPSNTIGAYCVYIVPRQ